MAKAKPLDKVTRGQWQRWRELDNKRTRGKLSVNEHEEREWFDLMEKIRAVSAFWQAVRP